MQGRPLRVRKNSYIADWEENRRSEINELTSKGVIPVYHDIEQLEKEDKLDDETMDKVMPFLMGKVAAVVNEKKPAKEIVNEMVAEAVAMLEKGKEMLARL